MLLHHHHIVYFSGIKLEHPALLLLPLLSVSSSTCRRFCANSRNREVKCFVAENFALRSSALRSIHK